MSLRDIKRQARRDLHALMRLPALYIAAPGGPGVLIHIRVHTKFDALGLKGAEAGLAERRELIPKIIFMRDELDAAGVVPKRNAVVSVEPGEAYRLDNADAPDDISLTFFVTALKPSDTVALPTPGAP